MYMCVKTFAPVNSRVSSVDFTLLIYVLQTYYPETTIACRNVNNTISFVIKRNHWCRDEIHIYARYGLFRCTEIYFVRLLFSTCPWIQIKQIYLLPASAAKD